MPLNQNANLVADLLKKKGAGTEYDYSYDPASQGYSLTGQSAIPAKKKGGTVEANKSRGYRTAADGITQRGKTRGRFV